VPGAALVLSNGATRPGWGLELIPMVTRGNAGRERPRAFMPRVPLLEAARIPGFCGAAL